MNFKHRRPRKSRSGCGLCKPHKKIKNGYRFIGSVQRAALDAKEQLRDDP